MVPSCSTVLAITRARAAFCTAVSMPSVIDWLRGKRASQATAKPRLSMVRLSTRASGARDAKCACTIGQFLTTAITTMSTNSPVAMRVARGSKRSAQAVHRWRATMPSVTGTPITSATWPIIKPTGTFTARSVPMKCASAPVTMMGSVKMVSKLAMAVKPKASATSPRAR